ncbi:MAG: hypothetical protein GWP59_08880 [Chlamydiales bacterium]|nr:hypothetical protein [Chlamydiales bacterium]NCF71799.1 hypothetical protein [Chlamydiales bacterium]
MFKTLKYGLICLFVVLAFFTSNRVLEAKTTSSAVIMVHARIPKSKVAKKETVKIQETEKSSSSRVILEPNNNQSKPGVAKLFTPTEFVGEGYSYTLMLDSQNGFKLKNNDGVELDYNLSLDKKGTDSSEDELVKSSEGIKLNKETLDGKEIYVKQADLTSKESDEAFSDTIKVSIIAN